GRSPRSARGWMGCPWPSRWPPRASRSCRRRPCWRVWKQRSRARGHWGGGARPARPRGVAARRPRLWRGPVRTTPLAVVAAARGEAEVLRGRHAAYYLALAEQAEPALTGAEQAGWLERLEREHNNLRAALRWAQDGGEGEIGSRLAAALWRFWYVRGHLSEGRTWLESFLGPATSRPTSAEQGTGSAATQARALIGAGVLANIQGDYARAAAWCDDSLSLYRNLGDQRGMAMALNILGDIAAKRGDDARALALSEESLAVYRELGDRRGVAVALNNLGAVLLHRGDHARAAVLCAESLAVNRELG